MRNAAVRLSLALMVIAAGVPHVLAAERAALIVGDGANERTTTARDLEALGKPFPSTFDAGLAISQPLKPNRQTLAASTQAEQSKDDTKDAEPSALTLSADREVYNKGDALSFKIDTNKTCYLTVINIDVNNASTVLFPNKWKKSVRIKKGKTYKWPRRSDPYRFKLNSTGNEKLVALCAKDKSAFPIKHDFKSNKFTNIDTELVEAMIKDIQDNKIEDAYVAELELEIK